MSLAAFAAWVAGTPYAAWAAGSSWAYPAAGIAHLLALVLLLGGIGLVDLRLVGAFRSLPLRPLVAALTPLAIAGLALFALSGSVLFAADAEALAGNAMFQRKLWLVGLGLANAVLFRWLFRSLDERVPPLARVLAVLSLLFWLGAAASGHLIAYS